MAESKTYYNTSSSTESVGHHSQESPHVECPICLEQFHDPKSLPCSHSFCKECLGSYIIKELSDKNASAFSCPVCRKVTEPPNPTEAAGQWVEQFPKYEIARGKIGMSQRMDAFKSCRPCEKQGKLGVRANFWCRQYNTFFCFDCKINRHDMFHEECDLEDISGMAFSDITPPRDSMVNICRKHNEKIDYFCETHQLLGCSKCIILDHRKCEVVTSAKEAEDKLRNGVELNALKSSLQYYASAMTAVIKDIDEHIKKLAHDQDTTLRSLSDLRDKINARFDELQKGLTNCLMVNLKESKESLVISRQECEHLRLAVNTTMASSKDTASMEDSVGTIILFQKGQAEVASCMRLIKKLEKSSSTTITHGYDTSAFDTATNLTMGKLVVHKQRMTLPSAKYVPLPQRQLKAIGSFNIRLPSDRFACSPCGIVFLPGECVAVADKENKNIKLYKDDGAFLDAIDLSGKPCEICRVDMCTVATIVSTGTINIFKVSNSKLNLTSSIKVDIAAGTKCHGITCCYDAFVVGTSTSLFYVGQNGRKEHIHKIGSSCLHLASDQRSGNVFFSVEGNMPNRTAVSRLSSRTITNILQTGTLKEARGIDVDREQNVYVCGFVSNNVIQMSQDGSHVRELLTSSDGINQPRAISVWEDKVVITNQSPNQRNTVKLFRLV